MAKEHVVQAKSQQLLRREKRHSSLLRSPVSFALIAPDARGCQVLGCGRSALRLREYVVEGQVLCVSVVPAILAAIAVPYVNAGAFHRIFAAPAPDMNVLSEPHDRRDFEFSGRRAKDVFTVKLFDK